MNFYQMAVVNLFCSLLPVIAGGLRIKLMDKATKIFYGTLIFAFLTECVALFAAIKYHDNHIVYNIADIGQFFLIIMYFTYCIKLYRRFGAGIYIGLISVLLCILNMIFLQSVNSYNSNFFLYEAIMVLVMTMILFSQFMKPVSYLKIQLSPHFWIVIVLIFFYVFNFFAMSLYDYFTIHLRRYTGYIDYFILAWDSISNVGFALVFLFYAKMEIKHA